MTLRGHPYRMPLVARHHLPRLPAIRGNPQDHSLWNYVKAFDIIQAESGRIPPLEPCQLQQDSRDPQPVDGPPARAEAIGLGMDPRLLPVQVVPQLGPCPRPVDRGQEHQRAGAQGALFPRFQDEGHVSLGKDPRPLACFPRQLQQLGQPVQVAIWQRLQVVQAQPIQPLLLTRACGFYFPGLLFCSVN